ncbi:MAG: hypothetical protein Q4Q04_00050 [Methanocorpusculum sp.]|nr:hypothetical protein [Methanocorpusculum sp.]
MKDTTIQPKRKQLLLSVLIFAGILWITGLGYYNASSDTWREVPVFNAELPDTVVLPTEDDFAAGGGFIHTEGVQTPQHGYLNVDFRALYGEGAYISAMWGRTTGSMKK